MAKKKSNDWRSYGLKEIKVYVKQDIKTALQKYCDEKGATQSAYTGKLLEQGLQKEGYLVKK